MQISWRDIRNSWRDERLLYTIDCVSLSLERDDLLYRIIAKEMTIYDERLGVYKVAGEMRD